MDPTGFSKFADAWTAAKFVRDACAEIVDRHAIGRDRSADKKGA
jgi:hypothetical protein